MAVSNVWVFAQGAEGAPTTATQELLTKAREFGGSVTAFVVGDAGDIASGLGEFGATKVYATGDLDGHLPGVAGAAAMKAVIDGGDAPDLIMFPQNYEGRDIVSRLSVKLDKPVLTNNVDIAVEGRRRHRHDAGVRRNQAGVDDVHRSRSVPGDVPPEELRRRGVGRRGP